MTKRYRESIDVTAPVDAPDAFVWRGSTYRVVAVLGHWREDAGYWSGGGVEIPQRDLWRVEARNGTPGSGVYELVREAACVEPAPAGTSAVGAAVRWRLDRVWD